MHYTTLIDPAQLAANLGHPDWVVVDCRYDLFDPGAGRVAYLEGHLPGARFADLGQDLSAPVTSVTGRHPLPDPETFAETLGRWGIDHMVQVVAYDADSGAFASRLWWMLRWMGFTRVAVLDGGLAAWMGAGQPLSDAEPAVVARHFEGAANAAMVANVDELAARGGVARPLLVDARTPERFRGDDEPIDPVAGHIPGAVNLFQGGNVDETGRFLPMDQLRARITEAIGDAAGHKVVHYCGSGVSACHNLLAMEHVGMPDSRLYPGSWSEWIRDAERPVATG